MELDGWKDFLHPNPFFPPIPRAGTDVRKLILTAAVFMLLPIATFTILIAGTRLWPEANPYGTLFWVTVILVVLAVVVVPIAIRHAYWNGGRVVPAMIDPTARVDIASGIVKTAMVLSLFGPVGFYSDRHVRVLVRYVYRGKVRTGRATVLRESAIAERRGEVFWIMCGGPLPIAFVTTIGLMNEAAIPVRPEAAVWFHHAVYRIERRKGRKRKLRRRAAHIAKIRRERGRNPAYA